MLRADDFKQGATLGRYEIIKKLAVGGMAEIYLARVRGTAGFEKLVVLKRISPAVAEDQAFVQMFLDEARLAATLRHPNIADVFDVGAEDNSYYFAMEFIHGQDARSVRLAAHELGREVPLEVALGIIYGTTYALGYAHAKTGPTGPLGIVHRDVSPGNILVSYDGAVKLVDFGIARAESRTREKTRTGMLKGKVPYMSPEQCRGLVLDRRSDLFSLGTVMYELTCGVRPFDGHSEYDTLEMIVKSHAEPPTKHIPKYHPGLAAIVMKLLARDPADRYQSAEDVLAELEKLISDAGLLVSERVVAKYMRELFADEIAEWELAQQMSSDGETEHPHSPTATFDAPQLKRSDLSLDLTPLPSEPTREFPRAQFQPDDTTTKDHIDLVSDMQPLLVTPDVQVFVRRSGVTITPDVESARSGSPTTPMPAPVIDMDTPTPIPVRAATIRPPKPPRPPSASRPANWRGVPMPDRTSPNPVIRPPAERTGSSPVIRPTALPPRPTTAVTAQRPALRHPDFQDESPTNEPDTLSKTLPGYHIKPTRPPDFTDEVPTIQKPRSIAAQAIAKRAADTTRLDAVLPFDPILARGDEILEQVDANAPQNETSEDRAVRRIGELAALAGAWLDAGDLDQAVVAADLVLEEDLRTEHAKRAFDAERPTLQAAFEAFLGDPSRIPALRRPFEELDIKLDPRASMLLARVDGRATLDRLIAASGMTRFEAIRWLCRLLLRKVIVLA